MFVRILAMGIASAALSSCALDSGDYAVAPTWLINGIAPTAEDCAAFGVERVELRITRPASTRVVSGHCADGLEFDDGEVFGGFITTAAFQFGKSYGYDLRLVNGAGEVVAGAHVQGTFRAYADSYLPWVLDPLEIFAPEGNVASYTAAWTAGRSVGEGCAELGIDSVALDLTSRTDEAFEHAIELDRAACTAGSMASAGPVLTYGSYLVRYVALDERGAVVDESPIIGAVVEQPGELKLDVARFDGL